MTDLLQQSDVREATERAARIRLGIVSYLATLADIRSAWDRRDWQTLGYTDWDSYLDGEFSETRLRVPAEHRTKAITELRMAGMSNRAIGAAVGISEATVRRGLSTASDDAVPDRIMGLDGKERPASQSKPSAPVRPPSPDAAPAEGPEFEKTDTKEVPAFNTSGEAGAESSDQAIAAAGSVPAMPWPVATDTLPQPMDESAHAARVSNDVRRLITLAQTFGSDELRKQAIRLYADNLGNAPMPPSGVVSAPELRKAAEAISALAEEWTKK